jgi:hypothetical protein
VTYGAVLRRATYYSTRRAGPDGSLLRAPHGIVHDILRARVVQVRALFQARFDPGNEVHARTLQAALDAQARPNECGEPDRTHSRVLACTTLMWVCAHAVWPVRSLGEWGPLWQARAVAIKPSAELAKEFAEAAMVRARVVEDACECVHVRAYAFVRGKRAQR